MPARLKKGLARDFKIDREKADREKRTIELAFSSEEPVLRWNENEVLSHDKGDYDFSRLNDSHPLLLGHDEWNPRSQIGVIESAQVGSDKKGRAIVRFGSSELASEIFQDVMDGIRQLVSVGYDRTGIVESKKASDGMVTTRYRWQPTHIAIVPVPADTTVGVGRDRGMKKRICANCGGDGNCPNCGGSGKRQADDENEEIELEDCMECDGSGRCGDCRGNGYIKTAKGKLQEAQAEILMGRAGLVDSPNSPNAEHAHKIMTATETAPALDESKIRTQAIADAKKALQERKKELRKRGDEVIKDFPQAAERVRSIVDEAVETDEAIAEVSFRMLKEAGAIKPAKQISMASLGANEKQIGEYSIARAIQSIVRRNFSTREPDGFEGEIHQEMMKRSLGFEPAGFMVPADAKISAHSMSRGERRRMGRDLQVGVFAQGGATVATELMTPIIEILRNRMVTERLGVRVIAGLEGNVVIPRQTGAGTAYAVSEIAALTVSTQALDQIAVTPRRVGTQGIYSKQLVLQSSIDVESFMRDDFMKVLAIMWDHLILNGQGANSEPLGIMQTPGIGSVTFGASATYAKLVSFHTAVATANADVGEMAYVTSPNAEGVLRSAAKLLVGATTVAAYPLWDGPFAPDSPDGIIAGYRAASTNQIPNNLMLFGVFSETLHCLWGGYDVVVDPFTLAGQAEVKITINTWGDVAVRHPQCFALSTDSAAQ